MSQHLYVNNYESKTEICSQLNIVKVIKEQHLSSSLFS